MMALDQTNLKEFIKYFQDTWLVGQFPPMLWNVFGLDEHFIFNSNISKIVLLNNYLNKTRRRNETNLILVGKMGVGEMGISRSNILTNLVYLVSTYTRMILLIFLSRGA